MKVRYDMQKGFRYHRYFVNLYVEDMWYCESYDIWFHQNETPPKGYKSYSNSSCIIKTLKAAKRHIRKHPEIWGKWCTLNNKFFIRNKKGGSSSYNIRIKKEVNKK